MSIFNKNIVNVVAIMRKIVRHYSSIYATIQFLTDNAWLKKQNNYHLLVFLLIFYYFCKRKVTFNS